jgi:hypothetical protein
MLCPEALFNRQWSPVPDFHLRADTKRPDQGGTKAEVGLVAGS